MSATPKNYQLRALGWGVEITSHRLSRRESAAAKQWLNSQKLDPKNFSGSLEEILPKYNCYSTNHWQSGIVPLLDLTRLILVDSNEEIVFSLNSPREMAVSDPGYPVLKACPEPKQDMLIYTEESKGLFAVWPVTSPSRPQKKDFTILKSLISIEKEEIWYISGIQFRGKELEADYDYEDIRGKAAYSSIIPAQKT
jgi:hypothetical protein